MADIWLIFLFCYLAFIVLFMAIPASLGFSFGIRNLYLATLYKVFEVSHRGGVINRLLMLLVSGRAQQKAVKTCLILQREYLSGASLLNIGRDTSYDHLCDSTIEENINRRILTCTCTF